MLLDIPASSLRDESHLDEYSSRIRLFIGNWSHSVRNEANGASAWGSNRVHDEYSPKLNLIRWWAGLSVFSSWGASSGTRASARVTTPSSPALSSIRRASPPALTKSQKQNEKMRGGRTGGGPQAPQPRIHQCRAISGAPPNTVGCEE